MIKRLCRVLFLMAASLADGSIPHQRRIRARAGEGLASYPVRAYGGQVSTGTIDAGRVLQTAVPDADVSGGSEPVTGWRVWRVSFRHRTPELRAITQTETWPVGQRMRAACRITAHSAPTEGCRCGIYGFSEPMPPPYGLPAAGFVVVGQVALWGQVVVHRAGYRAEFAYPQRIGFFCMRCLEERRAVVAEVVLRDSPYGPLCSHHRGFKGEPVEPILQGLLDRYQVDRLPPEPLAGGLIRSREPTIGESLWWGWGAASP